MKTILSSLQIEVRDVFRRSVLAKARSKGRMKEVVQNVVVYTGLEKEDAMGVLRGIPSIGEVNLDFPASSYLTMYWPSVSLLLQENKTNTEVILKVWAGTKKRVAKKCGSARRLGIPQEERKKAWEIRNTLATLMASASVSSSNGTTSTWSQCK